MAIKRTDINGTNPSDISTVFEGGVARPSTGSSTSTSSPANKDQFATKEPAKKAWDFAVSRLTGSLFAPRTETKAKPVVDPDFPTQMSTYHQADQAVFDLFNDVLDQGILSGAGNLVQSSSTKASDAVAEIRSTAPEIVADISGGFGQLFIDILAAGERVASGETSES